MSYDALIIAFVRNVTFRGYKIEVAFSNVIVKVHQILSKVKEDSEEDLKHPHMII